ncbi:hypothetical protein Tco_0749524 [Tanacetum coccineum]|uniref:Xylulose kinase-1 n=1 Tax=Tanacetum coccineum TaxID=301880 RepID=A0ABQ4Z1Q2_9ASTR
MDASVNNTNTINTVSPTVNAAGIEDNVVDESIVYGCADDPNMPDLEDIASSENRVVFGAEADMTNLDTYIPVSPILTTRIHKDHRCNRGPTIKTFKIACLHVSYHKKSPRSESHNMVAYLEKSIENDDFAQIVDFLNAHPIRYAFTVNPTIYVSFIEQFWSTAKAKTINEETQIHATVDGKKIVITQSSIRSDLQLVDDDGIDCLPNNSIFENLQLMGSKSTACNEFGTNIASAVICLATNQKFKFSKLIFDEVGEGSGHPTEPQHTSTTASPSQVEPITVPSSSQPKKTHRPRKAKRATEISQSSGLIPLVADETGTGSGSGPRCQDTILRGAEAQTRFETASKQSNDPPFSRVNTLRSEEDRLKLKEMMDLCTKLSNRVLDLETTKTAQAKEIASLKKRVKKLERKRKSKTPGMDLFKIVMDEAIERVYEADKDVEGDAEQVISAAAVDVSTGDAVTTASVEVNTASAPSTTVGVSVSTAEPITTASVNITTAEPSTPLTTTTTVIEDEDLTIAQTLMKMKSEKSKVRGVVMKEPSETATRPTIPPQQHDPKDKGKGKMVEQEKPLKKKEQIKFDKEIAQRLQAQMQAKLEEEERLLAARLQAQEQEELTIEERSKMFVKLMDKRKKNFARLRAKERRRKPPTKAQKRNQMCTYLKNMAGFTHNQLKNKSFDEVQKAFNKTMSWIDSFVPMDSEVVKGSKDKAEDCKKRTRKGLDEESVKRQKLEDDAEKAELKLCLEIVPNDDKVVNFEPLAIKSPIVDWKTQILGEEMICYQIKRTDGSCKMYKVFYTMLNDFDRQDLIDLYRLVTEVQDNKTRRF